MVKATILAEYRFGKKAVLLEQVSGEFGSEYRVTLCRRFPTLDKAKAAFFPETSPRAREYLEKQIKESSTEMHSVF